MQVAIVGELSERCIAWVKKHHKKVKVVDLDKADIVFSVFYNKIFTDEFISRKEIIYNFHGGILPQYRGSGTFAWAIINGEKETGITLHIIKDSGIDNGDVIDVEKFKISENDTAESLYKIGEETIYKMFIKYFGRLCVKKYSIKPNLSPAKIGKLYLKKDLQDVKDLTKYVRALTFKDKESAYYFNSKGKKIYTKWND